jgi:hypothetical protein
VEPFGVNWGFVLAQVINLCIFVFVMWILVKFAQRLIFRRKETPLDVLKGRLARGEITEHEYERLRALVMDEPKEKPKRMLDEDSTVDSLTGDIYETAASRRHKRDDNY